MEFNSGFKGLIKWYDRELTNTSVQAPQDSGEWDNIIIDGDDMLTQK